MSSYIPQSVELGLASHFECPVCFDYVFPPIQQCPQGHLICRNCRGRLSTASCPSCRCPLVDGVEIRNLALEKIADDILFPCKFAQNGCMVGMKWTETIDHEKECPFRLSQCPIPHCSFGFEGNFPEIVEHMAVDHHLSVEPDGMIECTIGDGESNFLKQVDEHLYAQLMSCHGQHFLVMIQKVDIGRLFYEFEYYGVVLLIGPRDRAQDFTYRMETRKGKRKFSWESSPLSIVQQITEAFDSGDCFHLNAKKSVLLGRSEYEYEDEISIGVSVFLNEDNIDSPMDELTQDYETD